MRVTTAFSSVAVLAGLAIAAPAPVPAAGVTPRSEPYSIPSDDGFPTPNPEQLRIINDKADGTLSDAPPPKSINETSFPIFQLIAHNENFEVAFFSSLIHNVTNHLPGYDNLPEKKRTELLDILETVLAQEKLHALNAANTLKRFNAFVPTPCTYRFPTTTLRDAIALAERFTDLVLGTLQDAAQALARNGDVGPVRGVTSSLGQEGQQEGFYRILLGKKPSEKPFLTTNVAPFLFSAVNQYVVKCPFDLKEIKLPVFPPVQVLSGSNGAHVEARDQHLSFHVDLTNIAAADKYVGGKGEGLWITYFSGQLLPISVPIENVKWTGRTATFEAAFPFSKNVMYGLSIASLTTKKDFQGPGEVAGATLAAPGLIQVDDRVVPYDGYAY